MSNVELNKKDGWVRHEINFGAKSINLREFHVTNLLVAMK